MHRINFVPAYILHTRAYGNSSLIVDFFSQQYGRISAIARSARGPKSRYQGQLQLFTPMLISWSGRYELKTLGNVELNGLSLQLNQKALFCGFYLNELLIRLLHKEDPHPQLFQYYHESLSQLEKKENIAPILRFFEKKLLEELGYGLPLQLEAKTHLPISHGNFYRYEHHQGFFCCAFQDNLVFLGADLIKIAKHEFDTAAVLQSAKRLMRLVLTQLLGNNPLNSRGLF